MRARTIRPARSSTSLRSSVIGTITETPKCESGICLGGIGTGGVEIHPDGRLHHWNLFNNRPWAGYEHAPNAPDPIEPAVLDTDWFVRIAQKGRRPLYRWLFTGHGYAVTTASHFWRVHKYFFIKSFPEIHYRAEYPFVYLTYADPALPVQIELRAWSSFVPHDVKNSSLPGCFFDFTMTSRSAQPLHISLVWQQQNMAGYAAPKVVQEHEKKQFGALHLVDMRGSTAHPDHQTSGDMCIWALAGAGQRVTSIAANPYMQNLIWPIHLTGALDGPIMPPHIKQEELNPEPRPNAPNKGWICVEQRLLPRAKAEINLGLSWFFPNHISVRGTRIGHMYENWFASAVDVARYQAEKRDELLASSHLLPSEVMRSSLPEPLKLALLDQLSTLITNSQFIKSGRFGIQEGHGCCSHNTMDVDHYASYALSLLMPQLRRTVLAMHTAMMHPKNGKAYHGFPGTVEEVQALGEEHAGYSRWDVCCQYTLQLYRDTKWAGDMETLRACYPAAKRTMELVASLDFYGIGLPYIQGGMTYDHWNLQGVVAYVAGVYCAALRALEEMAKVVNDPAAVDWARERFAKGVRAFEKYLWNGRQYLLFYGRRPKGWKPGDDPIGEHRLFEPVKPPTECMTPPEEENCGPDCACRREKPYIEIGDTGVMTDLLNGNGTAAVMGLGAFLNPARVRRQLLLTLERNVQPENFALVNGSYPDQHYPDQWPFMQWQTPWTGSEYFFALMCYGAGLVAEGDRVIGLVHERHAREGMRFDHAECNNHYARPLSIWGAYAARVGLDYDGLRGTISIRPAHSEPYDGVLVTAVAIGRLKFACDRRVTRLELRIVRGEMAFDTLVLRTVCRGSTVTVRADGAAVKAVVTASQGVATVRLDRKVTLRPGSRLLLTVA